MPSTSEELDLTGKQKEQPGLSGKSKGMNLWNFTSVGGILGGYGGWVMGGCMGGWVDGWMGGWMGGGGE